jgi:hypothetical protein
MTSNGTHYASSFLGYGWGVLSSAAIDNRRGYAGYEFWPQPAAP